MPTFFLNKQNTYVMIRIVSIQVVSPIEREPTRKTTGAIPWRFHSSSFPH